MSPRISYAGTGFDFAHPSELLNKYPLPPLQPLGDWPSELALFQERLAAAAAATDVPSRRRGLDAAFGVLISNHLLAAPSDAPGGAPSAEVMALLREFSPLRGNIDAFAWGLR